LSREVAAIARQPEAAAPRKSCPCSTRMLVTGPGGKKHAVVRASHLVISLISHLMS
jgi:hypothetical protein